MHSTRDDIVHEKEEIDVNKIFWRAICLKIFYDNKVMYRLPVRNFHVAILNTRMITLLNKDRLYVLCMLYLSQIILS